MSITYSKVVDGLTRAVLAADLSTQPQFRGMGRHSEQLLQLADSMMHDDSHRNKIRTGEAQVIASAVWYDHLKPDLLLMLDSVCSDRKHSEQVLNRFFSDKGITYRG